MEIMNAQVELKQLVPAWETFRKATDIMPIRDEAHYERMVRLLEALLDQTAGDETHPLMGLVDIVGDLIEDYETTAHPPWETNGLQALRFLMEQHGVGPDGLPEVGDSKTVGEVLGGQRDLNLTQVRALGKRFGVAPGTFV
jgi:HTH-type transcriptional regulator / antitoxin HigA